MDRLGRVLFEAGRRRRRWWKLRRGWQLRLRPRWSTGAAGAVACASNPSDYAFAFQDPCQPIEDRISDLLAQLTTDEKQSLLRRGSAGHPRLGLPGFTTFTEGIHGIGWSDNGNGSVSNLLGTQFPQAFGLAEAWDPQVMKAVGATTGYEARVHNAKGIADTGRGPGIVVRAPLIDLGRDPRWGRTEESYGEDPYLVGELARGYLAGLHGDDPKYLLAASTLKHWLANNNEANRETSSANVDTRNLREYYSAPFEAAIKVGYADGIMTAYNQLNGTPAAVSPLLQSLLIGEWGYKGFITTDATLPGILVTNQHYYDTLIDSVAGLILGGTSTLVQPGLAPTIQMAEDDGLFSDTDLDNVLRPELRVRFRLGDLDPPSYVPYKQIASTETPWNSDASKAKALDVTHKTMVLLKNDAHALPLDPTAIGTIAVIGPRADSVIRDWYGGQAPYVVTPRQGIAAKLPAANILYAVDDTGGAATAAAAAADVAVVFVGNHPTCNNASWGSCPTPYDGREAVDRTFIELEPTQETLVEHVVAANPRTIVVLVSSYPDRDRLDQRPRAGDLARHQLQPGAGHRDRRCALRLLQPGRAHDHHLVPIRDRHPDRDHRLRHPPGHDLLVLQRHAALSVRPRSQLFDVRLRECDGKRAEPLLDVDADLRRDHHRRRRDQLRHGRGRRGRAALCLVPGYRGGRAPAEAAARVPARHPGRGRDPARHFSLSAVDLRYWDADNARYAVETGMVGVQIAASSADVRAHVDLRVDP